MKIVICGSMSFAKEMLEAKNFLMAAGHQVVTPEDTEKYADGTIEISDGCIGAQRKIKNDLINKHYREIQNSDAILILNYDKKGVKNYIGGNSFLEMGFAYVLGKKILVLNDLPETDFIRQELEAMQPVILKGDLRNMTY